MHFFFGVLTMAATFKCSIKTFLPKFSLLNKETLFILLFMLEFSDAGVPTSRKFLRFDKNVDDHHWFQKFEGFQFIDEDKYFDKTIPKKVLYASTDGPHVLDLAKWNQSLHFRYNCYVNDLAKEHMLNDLEFQINNKVYSLNRRKKDIVESHNHHELKLRFNRFRGGEMSIDIKHPDSTYRSPLRVSCKVRNRQGSLQSNNIFIRHHEVLKRNLSTITSETSYVTADPSRGGHLYCLKNKSLRWPPDPFDKIEYEWIFDRYGTFNQPLDSWPIWYSQNKSIIYWEHLSTDMRNYFFEKRGAITCIIKNKERVNKTYKLNTYFFNKFKKAPNVTMDMRLQYRWSDTINITYKHRMQKIRVPLAVKFILDSTLVWTIGTKEFKWKGSPMKRHETLEDADGQFTCQWTNRRKVVDAFTPECTVRNSKNPVLFLSAKNKHTELTVTYKFVLKDDEIVFRMSQATPTHVFGLEGTSVSVHCLQHQDRYPEAPFVMELYVRGEKIERKRITTKNSTFLELQYDTRIIKEKFGKLMANVNLTADPLNIREDRIFLTIANFTYSNANGLSSSFPMTCMFWDKYKVGGLSKLYLPVHHHIHFIALPKPVVGTVEVDEYDTYSILFLNLGNEKEFKDEGVLVLCYWIFDDVTYEMISEDFDWTGNPNACKLSLKTYVLKAYQVISCHFKLENPYVSEDHRNRVIFNQTVGYLTGVSEEEAKQERSIGRKKCRKQQK